MALDGILLHKIIPGIATNLPARIQKIWSISANEILFQIRTPEGKKQLLISCHSVFNRILITERNYPTPDEPSHFVMILRKYLEGARIDSIEQASLDRWCRLQIRRTNTLGDPEMICLYAELMGNYANLILVNKDNVIIDALKRIPPFENAHRTVFPGAVFVPVQDQNKMDPFQASSCDPSVSLTKQFGGFSPFLSKEVEYRIAHGERFTDIMREIEDSDSLFIANENGQAVFHVLELKHVGHCVHYPLMEGFDILYYHREEKERIRQISGDLYKFVKKQLKHQKTKLPRLLQEYDAAMDCERYRLYGDLLYAYNVQDTKGTEEIILQDFETGKEIRIPLDEKLDGRGNARKCFKKYNKLKKGQVYLQEQITICRNEIDYFEGLLEQLDIADFETATGIRDELIQNGYMNDKNPRRNVRKKKKNNEPAITQITTEDGTMISFGKNNLQNDYLTWHKAKKNEVWLHTQDYHGAHVVIHDNNPSESVLRLAAEIAAYYSAGRYSSSVPVIWCPVHSLKKIPGAKPGMVQLTRYQTIYIDPEPEHLEQAGIDIR